MYSARNTHSEYDVIRVIVKGINDMYSASTHYKHLTLKYINYHTHPLINNSCSYTRTEKVAP
jgi:hypothetical protein